MTSGRSQVAATALMALALAASPAYTCGSVEVVDCSVRYHLGPLPTNLLEVLLVLAIAAGLAAYRRRLAWRGPFLWPALLLLAAATLSTLIAPDRRAAAGLWKAYFVEPMLAFVVIAAIATSRRRARWLLAGLGLAGLIVAVANIDKAVAALAAGTFNTVTPPVAIFNTANAVALYLVPLDALALAIFLFSDDARERVGAAVFLAVTALAVALSFSRAGWATLAVVVVFVGLFHRLRWWLAGAVVTVGVAALAVPRVRQRVRVEFDLTSPENTFNTRLSLWRSTINLLRHEPVLGSGLGGFKAAIAPYKDAGYREDLIYPHNIVLNFWVETGLLGVVAFAWLLVVAVREARGALAAGLWPRLVAIGVLGLVVAFVVHGLVDVPYFKNDQALAFWALLGIQQGSVRAAVGKL